MTTDFVVNFFAGIVTTLAMWVTVRFIFPLIQLRLRPTPHLTGSWKYFDLINGERIEVGTAEFKQSGGSISAIATRTKGRRDKPNARCFNFVGKYSNGCVRIEFEEIGSGGLTFGNLFLYLSSNHKQLDGYTLYFDRDEGVVVAHKIIFERVR